MRYLYALFLTIKFSSGALNRGALGNIIEVNDTLDKQSSADKGGKYVIGVF